MKKRKIDSIASLTCGLQRIGSSGRRYNLIMLSGSENCAKNATFCAAALAYEATAGCSLYNRREISQLLHFPEAER